MKVHCSILLTTVATAFAIEVGRAGLPYPIVGTGQAKCYNNRSEITPPQPGQPFYGQDAQFPGHPASYTLSADGRIKGYDLFMPGGGREKTFFVLCVRGNRDYGKNDFYDNGDGTITDRATGLMWSRADSGQGLNWQDALAWVQKKNAEKSLGHNDWRLPNVKELQSIVDYSRSPDATQSPAIDPVFNCNTITNEMGQADYPFYWSGTTHAGFLGGSAAMYIAFGRAAGWMSPFGMASGPPGPAPDVGGPPRGGPPGLGPEGWEPGDYRYVDVHGAGAQRSDPKAGDPANFPHGRGPQGDVIRIYNYVRLVRNCLPQ